MANNQPAPKFTVEVVTKPQEGRLTIGRFQDQSFTIRIKSNQAFDMKKSQDDFKITLVAGIGTGEGDLFASLEDANKITLGKDKEAGKNAWKVEKSADRGKVAWLFTAQSTLVLECDKPRDVATFNNFTYSSQTGKAEITVILKFGNRTEPEKPFSITKKAPDQQTGPTVLAFDVKPYVVWGKSEPSVEWDVSGLNLSPEDLSLVTQRDIRKLKSLKGVTKIPITDRVRLEFKPGKTGTSSVLAELELMVMRPGFDLLQPEDVSLDDSPRLVFHNLIKGGDGTSLYAIAGPPQGRLSLYLCGSAVKYWTSQIEDSNHPLPVKFASSPAVWFDNKIWLLGGSSYDTDHVSSEVWVGKQATGSPWDWSWKPAVPQPGWAAHMGHSALIFDGRLWVIGGWDGMGNSLKDAWVYEKGAWTSKTTGNWHGGCFFGAAVHEEQLYVYGGTKEPFSETLYNDTWIVDQSGKWGNFSIEGEVEVGKPIASCLAQIGKDLYLLAMCEHPAKNGFYKLIGGRVNGEWCKLPSPTPNMQRTRAFNLLAVEHEGLFVVRGLGMIDQAGGGQHGLFVYSPDSSSQSRSTPDAEVVAR